MSELVVLFCFFAVAGGLEGRDGFAAFGEGEEFGELGGADGFVALPEVWFEVGGGAGEAADDFEDEGGVGGEFGEAAGVGFGVHDAVAHGGPLDLAAVVVFPDHAVADAAADCDWAEDFEVLHGVFEGPCGVAAVDGAAGEVAAGLVDEGEEFPCLHIAGVVFDGDFDACVGGGGLDGFEGFDGVFDACEDAAFAAAVFCEALVASGDG